MEPSAAPTLRERKRLAAMRRIQAVALELFEREGFDAVPIERIAAEAEVSPSSVYRYFGTKEQLVIWDEYDPAAVTALGEQLRSLPPLEAVRSVITTLMAQMMADDPERVRTRTRLAARHPSIESAAALQGLEMAGLIAHVLAEGLGRPADDLEIRVVAHGLVGGILGTMRHWAATDFATPFEELIDAPLRLLEGGIDLR